MDKNLLELLKKAVVRSEGTRIQKVMKAPVRLIHSRSLEYFSLWFDIPIRIEAKTFWRENMIVIIPEEVSLSIYRYGFFEEDLTKMVLEYLKPSMTFIDIGAHFGYFTLLGSYLVGREGQVHSFEPTPSTFNILKNNVSDKTNIFINNTALFSKSKVLSWKDYGIRYSAFNSMYKARLSEDILKKIKVEEYKVEAISIDKYTENKDIKPDFIKIDAESAEYEILIGMERTIAKYHPIISIEVGDLDVKDVPTSKELITYLINKGYKPYEFRDSSILPHTIKNEQYQYHNILFLPD